LFSPFTHATFMLLLSKNNNKIHVG
jgi:hypothetical protein